jgi:hypothetical protein
MYRGKNKTGEWWMKFKNGQTATVGDSYAKVNTSVEMT